MNTTNTMNKPGDTTNQPDNIMKTDHENKTVPAFIKIRKKFRFLTIAACTAAALSCTSRAAVLVADFSTYPLGTIVGSESSSYEWVARHIASGSNADASVMDIGGDKLLRVSSSSTASPTGNRKTVVGVDFANTDFVALEQANISMGFSLAGTTANNDSAILAFTSSIDVNNRPTAAPAQIGYNTTNGIFVQAGSGTPISLLAVADVKAGYLYDFSLLFNMEERKFDITFTGVDINDNVVGQTISNLSFAQGGYPYHISGITIYGGRSDSRQILISSLGLHTIPEPGSAILLGAGIFWLSVFRRRRVR